MKISSNSAFQSAVFLSAQFINSIIFHVQNVSQFFFDSAKSFINENHFKFSILVSGFLSAQFINSIIFYSLNSQKKTYQLGSNLAKFKFSQRHFFQRFVSSAFYLIVIFIIQIFSALRFSQRFNYSIFFSRNWFFNSIFFSQINSFIFNRNRFYMWHNGPRL
mgnify:CR=1 FL=1